MCIYSDCTEESWKDETCLQFKMNKYFVKTSKIYQNGNIGKYLDHSRTTPFQANK